MAGWGVFEGAFAGVDQGTDWSGSGAIPALGAGVVTDVGSSGIIEGGSYPYLIYQLGAAPPGGSKYVYVAENFRPSLKVGDRVRRGQEIGVASGSYPYIEVGFNKGPKGWDPVAPLYPNPHSPKAAGQAMLQLIQQTIGKATTGAAGSAVTDGSTSQGSIYQAPPRPSAQDASLSWNPFNDLLQAGEAGAGALVGGASTVWDGLTAVSDVPGAIAQGFKVFLWLFQPKHWAMMAEVLVGVILLGLGFYWLGTGGESPQIPLPFGLSRVGKAASKTEAVGELAAAA